MSHEVEVAQPGHERPIIGRLLGVADRPWTAPICFGLTIVSVFVVGMTNAAGYYDMIGTKVAFFSTPVLVQAIVYTGALIAILGTHEMGHWLVSRWHDVKTSLPIFIPMPVGVGTFGAVIAMKELPRTRRALLRIGAAGPLAGGVVALALMAIAIRSCPTIPIPVPKPGESGGGIDLGDNLATVVLGALFRVQVPDGQVTVATPLFLASWVGFLLTSINLFPIGQLDGGHVAYALFGARANRWSKRIAVGVMMLSVAGSLGLFGGGLGFVPTYAFWGLLAFFVFSWHPPVPHPEEPLTPLDYGLALACVILFAICFMPVPIRTT